MNRCLARFLLPIILFYVGLMLLGGVFGFIFLSFIGILFGVLIGLGIGIIVNALVLIRANKICYPNYNDSTCDNLRG